MRRPLAAAGGGGEADAPRVWFSTRTAMLQRSIRPLHWRKTLRREGRTEPQGSQTRARKRSTPNSRRDKDVRTDRPR